MHRWQLEKLWFKQGEFTKTHPSNQPSVRNEILFLPIPIHSGSNGPEGLSKPLVTILGSRVPASTFYSLFPPPHICTSWLLYLLASHSCPPSRPVSASATLHYHFAASLLHVTATAPLIWQDLRRWPCLQVMEPLSGGALPPASWWRSPPQNRFRAGTKWGKSLPTLSALCSAPQSPSQASWESYLATHTEKKEKGEVREQRNSPFNLPQVAAQKLTQHTHTRRHAHTHTHRMVPFFMVSFYGL